MTEKNSVRVPRWLIVIIATAVVTQLGGSILTLWQLVPKVESLEKSVDKSTEMFATDMAALKVTMQADKAGFERRVLDLEAAFEERRAADRQFHIEQRIRLWDRLKESQVAQTAAENRLARVESATEHIKDQVDRLVSRLIGGPRD